MLKIKQSESTAARRRVPIVLVDATDGYSKETGLSSGFTVEISKAGATQGSGGGSITEIGDGQYYYECSTGDIDTLGFLFISIRHANCRDFDAVVQIIAYDPYAATNLGLSNLDATISSRSSHTANNVRDAILSDSTPFNGANINATISSRSSHAAADIWSVGTRALTDKDGFTISGTCQTFDTLKTDLNTAHGAGSWATATGFSTHSAADVWAVGTRALTDKAGFTISGTLTTLDALLSQLATDHGSGSWETATGFSTHTAADVWSVGTRALTDKAGFTISGTITTFDALDTALDAAHGAGSWEGAGAGASIQVIPSIPKNIDVSNTKLVRIALYVIDQSDDLPTTSEIDPGTITIERSADGGTSWSTVQSATACSEHAGCIYYDEVFDSGSGYASGDMIRITFKGQKVTIAANDHEIADSTDGMIFITRMDSGLSGGGPSAGDIADAVWDEPIADHTNTAQFGGKNQKVVPSETISDYRATGFSTHSAADVWTAGSRELSTPANYKADVSNLDVAVSTRSSHSASDVWSVGSRALTDKAGFSISGTIQTLDSLNTSLSSTHGAGSWATATGFSTHTAADVWSVGTRALTDKADFTLTTAEEEAIADAVWDEIMSGHVTSGSAGEFFRRLLGIAMKNCVLDDFQWDGNNNMTNGILYVYDTKANAQTHNKSTGLIGKFSMDATFDGSQRPSLRRWVEDS